MRAAKVHLFEESCMCVWRRCRRRRFSVLSLNLGVNWCNSRPTTTQPIVSKNIQKKWKKNGVLWKEATHFWLHKKRTKINIFLKNKKIHIEDGRFKTFCCVLSHKYFLIALFLFLLINQRWKLLKEEENPKKGTKYY